MDDKYDRTWACELECKCPIRPEIKKIEIGAQSKRVRGYRMGRLQFEGLVDDSKGHAKVNGWKMVFAGKFIPTENEPPSSQTYTISASSTHVRTQDEASEFAMNLLYEGTIELTVSNKNVFNLPIRI